MFSPGMPSRGSPGHDQGAGQRATVEGHCLGLAQGDHDRRRTAVVGESRDLAHHREHATGQAQRRAERYVDPLVDHRLAHALRRTSHHRARDDDAAGLVADHVDVGEAVADPAHHVPEDRDRRDVADAGVALDLAHQRGPDRGVRREGARDLGSHQPPVGAEEVDRAVGLAQEPVVQCAEQRGHGEDQRRGRQAEQDPPRPPLHVAQRDQDQGPTSWPGSRSRDRSGAPCSPASRWRTRDGGVVGAW